MTQNARLRGTQPAAVIAIIVRKFVLIARATSVGPVLSIGCNRQNDIGQFPLPRRVVLFVFDKRCLSTSLYAIYQSTS